MSGLRYGDEITMSIESLADRLASDPDLRSEVVTGERSDRCGNWWHRVDRHSRRYATPYNEVLERVIVRATDIVRSTMAVEGIA